MSSSCASNTASGADFGISAYYQCKSLQLSPLALIFCCHSLVPSGGVHLLGTLIRTELQSFPRFFPPEMFQPAGFKTVRIKRVVQVHGMLSPEQENPYGGMQAGPMLTLLL